jgi:hypothetical protein
VKVSRVIIFWVGVILVLFLVEVAELTHLFTLPIQSAVGNLLSFIFALVFTTILALIGAIFIGIYISQRLRSGGFTPFEEEMLRMRAEVSEIRQRIDRLDPPRTPDGPAGGAAEPREEQR